MDPVNFVSPIGRAVQGSFFVGSSTDRNGNPRLVKNGPRKGQTHTQFYVALAFAKSDPAWLQFEQVIKSAAASAWPRFWPQGAGGACAHPSFAIKILDGDGMDRNGQSNRDKEGFAGHWVVKFSSGFAPTVYPQGRYTMADAITDRALAPLGYYYRVAGTITSNQSLETPGLYINMSLVEVMGAGDVIVPQLGPDPNAVFGNTPATGKLPSSGHGQAVTPPPASGPNPVRPAPVLTPPPAPSSSYMRPVMTPAANGVTYDAYKAAGWSDDQLRSSGLMA